MRATYHNHGYRSFLVLLAVASSAGCADKKETEEICVWVFNEKEECPGTGDETGGEDETGGIDDGLPCSTSPGDKIRTVFQCNGSLNATIGFDTALGDCADTLDNPTLCEEFHEFGVGSDPYEMPAVMGCCDATTAIDESLYLSFCGADMIEQFCASIPYRLQSYIDNGAFPVGKNQAQKLQNYLAENQTACYKTFNKPSGTPGVFESTSWLVNGGGNAGWPLLKNFTITLDDASVTSLSLPDDESDYVSCYGSNFNNTEVFEGAVPRSPGIDSFAHLTSAGPASLVGPVVLGGRVTALATLSSESESCDDLWCSFMDVTVDEISRVWTLEELTLNADGVVSLTNGSATVDVERGSIRLYGVALGDIQTEPTGEDRGGDVYTIAPGTANLVISGVSGFASDVRWGKNATPITMHETHDGWTIDSFVVEHVDRAGDRWAVAIPSTTWK